MHVFSWLRLLASLRVDYCQRLALLCGRAAAGESSFIGGLPAKLIHC
jgi:hypothetical protein